MKQKIVSVITACKNNESTIVDTLNSVLYQTWDAIEYVIIDGASTDKTLSIINQYIPLLRKKCEKVVLISEEDAGIADAWNKGFKNSTGDIIFYLNADDWLAPDAIKNAVSALAENSFALSYGICIRVDSNKKCLKIIWRNFNPQRVYFSLGFSFTTCFVTRSVYEKIGLFNQEYKIALDIDFILRALKQDVLFICGNQVVYMRDGGVSNRYFFRGRKEYVKALIKNGFSVFKTYLAYFLVHVIYRLRK